MTEGDEPGFVIDVGHDILQYSPVCSYCRHATGFRSCEAFGDKEIPLPIWNGDNDHTKPYPGDNGIRFERGTPKILREPLPGFGNGLQPPIGPGLSRILHRDFRKHPFHALG